MSTIRDLFQEAQLAEAAYANFWDDQNQESIGSDSIDLTRYRANHERTRNVSI